MKLLTELLTELNDCRYAGESLAYCIVRLYNDDTSPMQAAARVYVARMQNRAGYRDSNPKIDIFRDGLGKGEFRYRSSTNWHRTCRDAIINAMLAEPGVAFKAYKSRR
jgi:hypothetical protein